MLRTTEQKRKYIQATRSQNYQASLKLEGITTTTQTTQTTQQSKAEILQKYKKYSQPES
ncbi:YhfG family protein (plasmid) [Acinetobacter johnsonii]|nr:YhfG family protein [Acinetobacter johnsonii]